ncbi:Stage II sporulation protein E (SpoIIE) [Nonomuraea coxensis DSM 45129]|uniref:Stage II sporulation protein E (SpoIIE) n=1 Tax=Nonomuraea coxensis DSM 45129 TaxID=1122611 RepID=A0ABX8U5G4_9ACTN|nr:PP2C family protein-serine/threonine phosphatase [Nonomuraea coxensis]QYC42919.1 Stage II sporulation protein E (SpoIIE) [Nonomuraea coxensis DSM 45129]
MANGGERRRVGPSLPTPVFLGALIAVTVALIALDSFTSTAVRLLPLLVFLPSIAAGLGNVRQTAFASVWVVLVMAGTLGYLRADFEDSLLAAGFTGLFGVAAVISCRYRVHREEEVYRLRSAAAALQRQIVRPLPLRSGDVVVDGLYQPVEEDAMVGGDMYEVAASPHGTRLLIADVQGKGLPAIGTALAVLGAFREAAHREPTLVGVVEAMESAVTRHNLGAGRSGEPERLVTALVLDIRRGPVVEAVNCGHIPPYIIHNGRAYQSSLGEPAVPLGVAALAPGPRAVAWFAFPAGATMLLCTDGVTEARDSAGTFYPLAARLRAWARHPPRRLAETVGADVRSFTGAPLRDDVAILTVTRTRGSS